METLLKLVGFLDGKKTYLLVLLGITLWLGTVTKWWSMEQVDELFALLGLFGVGAFRSALNKK